MLYSFFILVILLLKSILKEFTIFIKKWKEIIEYTYYDGLFFKNCRKTGETIIMLNLLRYCIVELYSHYEDVRYFWYYK